MKQIFDSSRAVILGMTALCVVTSSADSKAPPEFQPCLACHSVDVSTHGMAGPNLVDLIGRPVGGDTAFQYSFVLRDAGTNTIWTVELLEAFLEDPEGMFPGMWMSYPGINDAKARRDIVDYLSGFSEIKD